MTDDLKQAALDYHRLAPRGKIKVVPTKPMVTQRDLSLAYSPGVASSADQRRDRDATAIERGFREDRLHSKHRAATTDLPGG